jgi:hypothetical protein
MIRFQEPSLTNRWRQGGNVERVRFLKTNQRACRYGPGKDRFRRPYRVKANPVRCDSHGDASTRRGQDGLGSAAVAVFPQLAAESAPA